MKAEIILLNLLSPLFYAPDESALFVYRQKDGEKLYCFELEEAQARKFEPDRRHFPGALIFAGKAGNEEKILELKQGNYVFSQIREILNEEEVVDLAIEVQNEGLWQRLKLGSLYYVRYLFEDERGVTQIFRPYNSEK